MLVLRELHECETLGLGFAVAGSLGSLAQDFHLRKLGRNVRLNWAKRTAPARGTSLLGHLKCHEPRLLDVRHFLHCPVLHLQHNETMCHGVSAKKDAAIDVRTHNTELVWGVPQQPPTSSELSRPMMEVYCAGSAESSTQRNWGCAISYSFLQLHASAGCGHSRTSPPRLQNLPEYAPPSPEHPLQVQDQIEK